MADRDKRRGVDTETGKPRRRPGEDIAPNRDDGLGRFRKGDNEVSRTVEPPRAPRREPDRDEGGSD